METNKDLSRDRADAALAQTSAEAATLGRRALLLGAAAGGAGALTGVLAGASPAAAANGQSVLLGESNTATATTKITSTTAGSAAFVVTGTLTGIVGQSSVGVGVAGTTTANGTYGIHGIYLASGGGGAAVYGQGGNGNGIVGDTYANGATAVLGNDYSAGGGYGVNGYSGAGTAVYGRATAGTGVHGITQSTSAGAGAPGVYGVLGEDQSTHGGVGVYGASGTAAGTAMLAIGSHGATGLAASSDTGIALSVLGPTEFSLSGETTVAEGFSTVVVSGVSLRSNSLVLATIQQAQSGYSIAYASPNVSGRSVTIALNAPVSGSYPSGLRVAWFVVN
ncbi:MAG TPA: hypothetical protein VGS21_10635 [Acidimicrobiales bacterium]|nr:hypothetical protein [Acidimicrobiales bacterium]